MPKDPGIAFAGVFITPLLPDRPAAARSGPGMKPTAEAADETQPIKPGEAAQEPPGGASADGPALPIHHRHKQIRDARRTHLTQRRQLLAIHPVKQPNALSKPLALMHGLERPRRRHLLRTQRHLRIARLELLHAALEHDAAA